MVYTGEKKRQYDRQWMAARRASYFDNKSCVKCGSIENLELDHLNPSKKVNHRIWSWTQSRRDEEIAKCQVLCRVCHRLKTNQWLKERDVPKGEETGNSILTDQKVLEIRELWSKRIMSQKEIGLRYNVSRQTVEHVVNRRTWKHI